jgi:RNA polymerase sigma-70 factor (ECF subfamily)
MNPDSTALGGRAFPSTNWSHLLSLRDPRHPAYVENLNALIAQYWKPVYHYVRALRDVTPEDARDLTQQFFAMLLSRHDLEKLSPAGTLRGFLKTALRHFLASVDRARRAREPRDGAHLLRFDEAEREWMAAQAAPPRDEEDAFDREWARTVLLDAVQRLEQVFAAEGKSSHFEIFRQFAVVPSGIDESPAAQPTYESLARAHGLTVDEVRHRLRLARARIREILAELLRGTLAPGESVDDELRFILSR